MITSLSIAPETITGDIGISRFSESISCVKPGFPFAFVGKGSYITKVTIEAGLDIFPGNVCNIHIGKYTAMAHDINFIIDLNHNYSGVCNSTFLPLHTAHCFKEAVVPKRKGQILIENDVWVARGVTIMGGVTIHNGAVIAANSTVTKDIPPYAIVGGNPAKIIKYRFDAETIKKLEAIQWWYWDDSLIQENASWFYEKAEDFAEHFYTEEKAPLPQLDIVKMPKQYLYFGDFAEEKYATWQQVITEFCEHFKANSDCGLIVNIPNDENVCRYHNEVLDLVKDFDTQCQLYLFVGDNKAQVDALFSYADYYITGRNPETIYHSCLAQKYGIKVISGVDAPIFD